MAASAKKNIAEQAQWYAIYCKSRHERQVNQRLVALGVETFLADYTTRVHWGARVRSVQKNLLPGYLLVRLGPVWQRYHEILQIPGVVKFVGNIWPNLSSIPHEQIASLQVMLGSQLVFTEIAYLSAGDEVEVVAGPLAGIYGRVLSRKNRNCRVFISVDLLKRSIQVEVDPALLAPVREKTVLA